MRECEYYVCVYVSGMEWLTSTRIRVLLFHEYFDASVYLLQALQTSKNSLVCTFRSNILYQIRWQINNAIKKIAIFWHLSDFKCIISRKCEIITAVIRRIFAVFFLQKISNFYLLFEECKQYIHFAKVLISIICFNNTTNYKFRFVERLNSSCQINSRNNMEQAANLLLMFMICRLISKWKIFFRSERICAWRWKPKYLPTINGDTFMSRWVGVTTC